MIEFTDDTKVALVMRKTCMVGAPTPGSVEVPCDKCGEPCWADARTIIIRDEGVMVEGLVCCHCENVHDPVEMLTRMLERPNQSHWHDLSNGPCACGMTPEEWARVPEGARALHDGMKRIYEVMREGMDGAQHQ